MDKGERVAPQEALKLLLSENSRLRGLAEEDEEDSTSGDCVMSV